MPKGENRATDLAGVEPMRHSCQYSSPLKTKMPLQIRFHRRLHGAAASPLDRNHVIMFVIPPHLSPAPRRVSSDLARARFFDQLLAERQDASTTDAPRLPAIDVSETDTAYRVSFELPGLTREQLKVSVRGRRVELETTEPAAATAPEERVLYRERSTPRFARTVSLPTEVDPSAAVAKYENGVLNLTLTKRIATGATQLDIG
jgi:HSP20 family protein